MVLVSGYILEIFRSSIILSTQVHIATTRILCCKTTDRSEYSDLFLEELVSHGEEGDGETASEEQNEVNSQLVSKQKNNIIKANGMECILWRVETELNTQSLSYRNVQTHRKR